MSKYNDLWAYIKNSDIPHLKLTFAQIKEIVGIDIDHSFLRFKKELIDYGYEVGKISLKEQTIIFNKVQTNRDF